MNLTDLTTDCLLIIFKYCSEIDLINLCKASTSLSNIIDDFFFNALTKDLLLCGHRNEHSAGVEQRNQKLFTSWERMEMAQNWMNGIYLERFYYHYAQSLPTKLYLERDFLYITHGKYLRKYRRSGSEALHRSFDKEICASTSSDIADFVKRNSSIFVGRVCGNCFVCDNEGGDEEYIVEQRLHDIKEYLQCVELGKDIYVTSTDRCCKVWHRTQELGNSEFCLALQTACGFKSIKLSADQQWLFGGLDSDNLGRAMRAIDIIRGEKIVLNSNTISIYDLKLKDDNVIFTCNSDSTLRMYDRRANLDVSIWEDECNSSFYCMEYDGLYAVLCGAKLNGHISLFDIRVPRKSIQLYFLARTQHKSHLPIYNLTSDSRFLFVATDQNLRVLDFKEV